MDRALAVTELLENVLVCVRPIDVLRCQRVSKAWRSAIQGSSTLQKTVCEVPILELEPEPERKHGPSRIYGSASHQDRGMVMTGELSAVDYCNVVSRLDVWVFNPFFETIFNPRDGEGDVILTHEDLQRVFSAKEHSYLDMYLTQPPIRRVSLRVGYVESAVLVAEREQEFRLTLEAFEKEKALHPFRAMSFLEPRRRTVGRQPTSVVLERWNAVNRIREPLKIRHLIEALER